jgi:hypothetical protein
MMNVKPSWIAVLSCVALVVGCGSPENPDVVDGSSDAVADTQRLDAQGTDVPGTDVPDTDVPGTDVPVTDIPVTDVPGDTGVADVSGDAGAMDVLGDLVFPDVAVADGGMVEWYVAVLSGAEEVPTVDTAATGTATMSYDPATRVLSWLLTHAVAGATAAHIHTAGAGETGPATITLVAASPASGAATLTAAQEADLRLGHMYVNVHSPANPGGEVRGQVLRPGETLWVARLTGAEEVPSNTSAATGAASLIVNAARTSAHYRMTSMLTPSAAHVHTSIAGVSGPARFGLTVAGTVAEGDQTVTAADVAALDATELYVDVHTTAVPSGEIRGQLLRAGSSLWVASLTGAQEVPAVTTTATGNASVALDYRSANVRYAVVTSLTPTASHIHHAVAGVSGPVILTFSPVGTRMFGAGALPAGEVDALRAGQLYTDVHTAAFPAGEIRGQILPR